MCWELQRTLRAWSYLIIGISRERRTSSGILICCIVGVFFFFCLFLLFVQSGQDLEKYSNLPEVNSYLGWVHIGLQAIFTTINALESTTRSFSGFVQCFSNGFLTFVVSTQVLTPAGSGPCEALDHCCVRMSCAPFHKVLLSHQVQSPAFPPYSPSGPHKAELSKPLSEFLKTFA